MPRGWRLPLIFICWMTAHRRKSWSWDWRHGFLRRSMKAAAVWKNWRFWNPFTITCLAQAPALPCFCLRWSAWNCLTTGWIRKWRCRQWMWAVTTGLSPADGPGDFPWPMRRLRQSWSIQSRWPICLSGRRRIPFRWSMIWS